MKPESWAARRRRMNAELARDIEIAYLAMQIAPQIDAATSASVTTEYVRLRYLQAGRDAL